MTQDFEIKDDEVVIKKDEEPVSEDLENMSYHSAMNLINDPNFLPTTTFSELIPMLQKLYKDGANWQKKQLLNDGIECTIDDDIDMLFADYTNFDEDGYIREQGLKPGDKVKVIMVKVEE